MASIKIEPAGDNKLWVSLTRFGDAELARLKQIRGACWNSERKQWSVPESPDTRKILAEIVAMPPAPPQQTIAVKPKTNAPAPKKPYHRYIPGKDKPLTTDGTSTRQCFTPRQ